MTQLCGHAENLFDKITVGYNGHSQRPGVFYMCGAGHLEYPVLKTPQSLVDGVRWALATPFTRTTTVQEPVGLWGWVGDMWPMGVGDM